MFHLPKVLSNKNNIKKTKCYQGILAEIKEYGVNKICKIYVNAESVKICDELDNGKQFYYSQYNFPNLSYFKQAILCGALVSELGLTYKYDVELCIEKMSNGMGRTPDVISLYHNVCFYAYDRKRLNKYITETNKIKNKQEKDKIKNGETW